MTTLADLIASIHSSLHSYTGVQEQVTWLTSAIDASVTTLAVNSSDGVQRGTVEIDNELVYVYLSDSGGLQLIPNGRGFKGSTAASHSLNATVTFDPVFPKVEIRRAVDQVILGLYPQLYRTKTTDLVYNSAAVGYDLPADCDGIVQVTWKLPSPTNDWEPIYRWAFDTYSPDSNGNKLNIYEGVIPGSNIRVVYKAAFGAFAAENDTLGSVGLPEAYADLILYAVCARMIRFLDPARLQVASVENVSRAQVTQAGDAGRIANQLYAMFQQRIVEERKRLLELTPAQINFQR